MQYNLRDITKHLFTPFAVYISDQGEEKGTTPTFYTNPGMTFAFNKEFVEDTAYEACEGIMYPVRSDISSFSFRAGFSIKETVIKGLKIAHGGLVNSDEDEIYLDGTTSLYSVYFETCFRDTNKIVRISMPKARSVDASEIASGEAHVVHPVNFVALVDPADKATFPSIYIQP